MFGSVRLVSFTKKRRGKKRYHLHLPPSATQTCPHTPMSPPRCLWTRGKKQQQPKKNEEEEKKWSFSLFSSPLPQ